MALHMQGKVVEEAVMLVAAVNCKCNEQGVVVVGGNYIEEGKDVMVMEEYVEPVDVEIHVLVVLVWKKMVVRVGMDALHKVVVTVTEEVL